ncbi:conserved hypothetical protein [Gloeothece citriformis PCC 7424]|uniref:DUF4079 domain-containing protein n=1 Tax=Gloeothece citriformis (strain PCC 7424) TaxID=65393 RepID=B7KI21_GLOC7|nr:DUF4079 domain-containing protein [Gloeothece citriformis]ACK72118.1 conserved hypothetical protein [Gloeothece citriformis PCC 7424]
MDISDTIGLIHPAIAIAIVFPFLGMVANFAWQTRQRRLQTKTGKKSQIPPVVGRDHVQIGKWLSGMIVGLALLGLAYPIGENILSQKLWQTQSFQVIFIILMGVVTIASFVLLYQAKQRVWRGIFATLTGMGIVILGCQDGVFRRTNEWYWSHYYIGITATLIMIFSLAIVDDIYRDKTNRWRTVHIVLNCFALLLFMGQGFTGARDLLEIPLTWQKPYIYQCDFVKLTCPK